MAAQEKNKPSSTTVSTLSPPSIDLLGPPPSIETLQPPPPAYSSALPPPQYSATSTRNVPPPQYDTSHSSAYTNHVSSVPPPSFTSVLEPPPFTSVQQPPPFTSVLQPPPPAFDSIQDIYMTPPLEAPPPTYSFQPMASAPTYEEVISGFDEPLVAPSSTGPETEVIMGFEGMSPDERAALLEEQRQIMEQIERDKISNKSAAVTAEADRFDMRSSALALSAVGNPRMTNKPSSTTTGTKFNLGGGQEVALQGPESTQAAIQDGTAMLLQCVNCENWMQVTSTATLMYCPVCAVVSPIDPTTAAMSKEEAMQMEADRKMAEQLQNEEYENAERPAVTTRARPPPVTVSSVTATSGAETSWWDTVSGLFSSETKPSASTATQPPSTTSFSSPPPATRTPTTQGARVAQRQPLFSCVVDSVSSTVGTLTGSMIGADSEGNVHGVDSTSLLAISQVGRDTEQTEYRNF
jgi:hypothetical protein